MTDRKSDPIQHNRQAYDHIAGQYARRNAEISQGNQIQMHRFVKWLAPGAAILDLGCGAGRDLAWFSNAVPRSAGSDLSIGMLREARTRSGAPLVQADMRRLPFAARSFQGVWCVAALLHLPREEAPHVLRQVGRILTPGGLLYLSVEKGEGEEWEPAPYQPPLERFYTRYTLPELTALLKAAGFVLVDAGEEVSRRHWLWIHARKHPPVSAG